MALGLAAALSSTPSRTAAEEAPVPFSRQAELLVRLASYDRNLPARARGTVRVRIVVNAGDADSRGAGAAMEAALRRYDLIAGLPTAVTVAPFAGVSDLADACRAEHVGIVYLAAGLDGDLGAIVRALDGFDLLTVGEIPRFVSQGIVLGFDLAAGRPVLLFNLNQAKRQNVAIDPKVIQLMRVVQ